MHENKMVECCRKKDDVFGLIAEKMEDLKKSPVSHGVLSLLGRMLRQYLEMDQDYLPPNI